MKENHFSKPAFCYKEAALAEKDETPYDRI